MGKAIEELAHFAAGTPWETIPEAVRERAKLVLLDTVGVILAGSVQPEVAGGRARLTATGGRGATVYAPGWPTTDPRTAALLNGLATSVRGSSTRAGSGGSPRRPPSTSGPSSIRSRTGSTAPTAASCSRATRNRAAR